MAFAYVFSLVGVLCAGLGLTMLLPMGIALLYREPGWDAFLKGAVFSIFLGVGLYWVFRQKEPGELNHRQGMAIVAISWFAAGFLGGVPLLLSGDFPTFTDAVFESISGFTTTGASVLTAVEKAQKCVLFWRAFTHWLGGMGFIVLGIAILPFLGVGGMQLFKAEVPSPTPDRLQPRIMDTASVLWKVYALLTAAQTLALMLCGLDWFDSLCHAFATMATGGFSTKNASMGAFGPAAQWVVTVFMVLAGINFSLHYMAMRGRLNAFWRDREWRFFMGLYLIFSLGITLSLVLSSKTGLADSLRLAFFQAATILTTTGFATADYLTWPSFALLMLIVLMFVGGSAGSTGGGPKCVRIMVIMKQCASEMRRLIHPRLVAAVKLGHLTVGREVVSSIWAFMGLYLASFIVVALVLAALGLNPATAFSASIACLGNIGPGLDQVGPAGNYAALPLAAKWVLSVAMVVGRLEIYTVLVLLWPGFWRD